jgi:hypothetical protein
LELLVNKKITKKKKNPTIKIPVQTPALKIPAIAEQPGNKKTISNRRRLPVMS